MKFNHLLSSLQNCRTPWLRVRADASKMFILQSWPVGINLDLQVGVERSKQRLCRLCTFYENHHLTRHEITSSLIEAYHSALPARNRFGKGSRHERPVFQFNSLRDGERLFFCLNPDLKDLKVEVTECVVSEV